MKTFELIEEQTTPIPMHLCNEFETVGDEEIIFYIMNTPRLVKFESKEARNCCFTYLTTKYCAIAITD